MNAALRPALGVYRLTMRINRTFWVMNVFGGLVLPLIVQAAFGATLGPAARLRLLLCNVILALGMVVFRKTGFEITLDRVLGQRDLLAASGVTRSAYLGAHAVDALSLGLLPLGVMVGGVLLLDVPAPRSAHWLVPYLLTVAVFYALGVNFACRAHSLPPVALYLNLAVMGAVAFCPVAYPPERVPALIRPLVSVLPPSLSAESLVAGWTGAALPGLELGLLGAWTLGAALAGWRRFAWTDAA